MIQIEIIEVCNLELRALSLDHQALKEEVHPKKLPSTMLLIIPQLGLIPLDMADLHRLLVFNSKLLIMVKIICQF
jgi:hypothetical protein